ncbi:rho GTPase-activating protein 4-like [Iris pallida]|uniref:Rho GTPase-activating protein 4-like n=1 Tax=Iris pallida TaxID=29817 RepID=A0AAX6E2H4_IRIPA|nr:rho GTPase-activating protein 4-like [Iris pallida]
MTTVLQVPSSPSSQLSCSPNDGLQTLLTSGADVERRGRKEREEAEEEEISLLALLVAVLRRSLAGCRREGGGGGEEDLMEIGWPTDVQHVAHVTFDRFHGFLGLPVEFEPEVPRRAPSASANVFGVSTESMQCSYDSRGNSVPTILLLMQRRLYERGGLQAEGIFRINAENSQEEYVRDQLNRGIVTDAIDVHCLAGLIKAWFRELPTGVLDPLTPEQVMQCQSEDECAQVVSLLPPTEAALLDWAINLMADVVQEEHQNKMNARNVAMVFAPNMTQLVDPLTALMYAVQVMNFLRMLILKNLKSRQESRLEDAFVLHSDPSDENGHYSPQLPLETCSEEAVEQVFAPEEPTLDSITQLSEEKNPTDDAALETSKPCITQLSEEDSATGGAALDAVSEETTVYCNDDQTGGQTNREEIAVNSLGLTRVKSRKTRKAKSSNGNHKRGTRKVNGPARETQEAEKSKGTSIVSRINSKVERIEAWR